MANTPDSSTEAALRALEGAIKTSRYRSVRGVAEALDMDYNTLWRYVKGKRDMPFHVLIRTLQLLGLSWEDFGQRVDAETPKD